MSKEKSKKKEPNHKRKEVWLPEDIVLKLRILAAKSDMPSKKYYEQVLTNHANAEK